jgi:fructose-1,6-bisphosphatase I
MVSEEEKEIILVDEEDCGPFVVTFDPLDGSSNIDTAIPIGSIFAVNFLLIKKN